ncbi:motility associated factor glycosyltransferase family protein [Rheinheimera marina]|uniref:Motility associated factor glycosyltransferase family protein n=1 Tax=Rheinheimera marina TaxID=1774958 RepID=A0ABV9JRQ7_9GAMM
MNECYQQNLSIIARRWPELHQRLSAISPSLDTLNVLDGQDSTLLINGVQLTSRHNRQAEAELQARQIAEESPIIELYGTGLGDVQRELLQRLALTQLNVHILSEHIFLLVIQLIDQSFWLNDPRVSLHFAADHQELRFPHIALPADLVLVSDMNVKIKERLIAQGDIAYSNKHIQQETDVYAHRILDNQPFWSNDALVQQLYASVPPEQQVFVIASGPSLEQHFDYLSQRQQTEHRRPLLIAVDTALQPLLQHGIEPDYVVTLDVKISLPRLLSIPVSSRVGLVYFPLSQTQVLEHWPGPRYIALNASQAFAELQQTLTADSLFIHGSVIHPALDLAVKMGGKHIVLFGADFAFANDKTHASWQDGALGLRVNQTRDWTLNGYGEKVKTLRNLQSYLIGVERYIRQFPTVRFYNSSKAGAQIQGTTYFPELFP